LQDSANKRGDNLINQTVFRDRLRRHCSKKCSKQISWLWKSRSTWAIEWQNRSLDVVLPQQVHKLAINYMTHPIHPAGVVCFHPGVGKASMFCVSMARIPIGAARPRQSKLLSRAMPCRDGVDASVGWVEPLRETHRLTAAETQLVGYGAKSA
jgi:hypothetical protein